MRSLSVSYSVWFFLNIWAEHKDSDGTISQDTVPTLDGRCSIREASILYNYLFSLHRVVTVAIASINSEERQGCGHLKFSRYQERTVHESFSLFVKGRTETGIHYFNVVVVVVPLKLHALITFIASCFVVVVVLLKLHTSLITLKITELSIGCSSTYRTLNNNASRKNERRYNCQLTSYSRHHRHRTHRHRKRSCIGHIYGWHLWMQALPLVLSSSSSSSSCHWKLHTLITLKITELYQPPWRSLNYTVSIGK